MNDSSITPYGLSSAEADCRAQLAELGPYDYGRERRGIAKRHAIPLKTLDLLYDEERRGRPREKAALELRDVEPWSEEVEGAELLDRLEDAIRRFVVIDPAPLAATSLWVVHAHAHDAFAISPILLVTAATKGCGKSTLLDVIGRLTPRPLMSAATTAAALYRTAEHHPTILCDEGDTYLGEANHGDQRLVTFFNAGHRRNVPFILCEGDDNTPKAYPCWCPKAIAMIGLPRAATISDRSIPVQLRRKSLGERSEDFSTIEAYPELEELARKCARWSLDQREELEDLRPELPGGFTNRLADNWRPLIAIAEVASGLWPERARDAAKTIGTIEEEGLEILLLEDFLELFQDRRAMYTEEAVNELNGFAERPWSSLRHGKGINGAWIAGRLRGFEIRPQRMTNGDARKRGYSRAQFWDAWRRYVPDRLVSVFPEGAPSLSVPSSLSTDRDGLDGTDTPNTPPEDNLGEEELPF